jgi:hypothetical protein
LDKAEGHTVGRVVDESELVWVAVASVAVPVEVELVAVGPLPPQKWEL